jgi:hypothetical protein
VTDIVPTILDICGLEKLGKYTLGMEFIREKAGEQHESALHRRAGRDARFPEPGLEPLAKLTGQPRHPRGGELFDADFYEQCSIHPCDRFDGSSLSRCDHDHGRASRVHDGATIRGHDVRLLRSGRTSAHLAFTALFTGYAAFAH